MYSSKKPNSSSGVTWMLPLEKGNASPQAPSSAVASKARLKSSKSRVNVDRAYSSSA